MEMIENGNAYDERVFRDIQAAGSTWEDIHFDGCTFRHGRFDDMTFARCRFRDCEFLDCRLDLAKVIGSTFSDVRFTDCRLLGIDWTRARWPSVHMRDALRFERCLLNDSSFFGLRLEGLRMLGCRALDVDFTDADCGEADFAGTDLRDSVFRQTRLAGANFVDAVNYAIDIFHNDIRRARFALLEAAALLSGLDIDLVE